MKRINGNALRMPTTVAAFLIPGLALWMKSGYSHGVAVFLIAALCALPNSIFPRIGDALSARIKLRNPDRKRLDEYLLNQLYVKDSIADRFL